MFGVNEDLGVVGGGIAGCSSVVRIVFRSRLVSCHCRERRCEVCPASVEVKLFFRVVFILHPPRLDWVGFRGLVGDIPYKETERDK